MTDAECLTRLVRLEILVAELQAIVDRLVYAAERDDEHLIIEARSLARIATEGLQSDNT